MRSHDPLRHVGDDAMSTEAAFLIGNGQIHKIIGERGQTPPCPAAKFKSGDVVKVRVVDVDIKRRRIGLTMRKDGGASVGAAQRDARAARDSTSRASRGSAPARNAQPQGAFAAAFADALKRK